MEDDIIKRAKAWWEWAINLTLHKDDPLNDAMDIIRGLLDELKSEREEIEELRFDLSLHDWHESEWLKQRLEFEARKEANPNWPYDPPGKAD